jgi:hypothetical protein
MPATQQITISLKPELLQRIRNMVALGQYATESALIEDCLIHDIAAKSEDPERTYWLECEIARRCHESDATPEQSLSCGDIRRAVIEELGKGDTRGTNLNAKASA